VVLQAQVKAIDESGFLILMYCVFCEYFVESANKLIELSEFTGSEISIQFNAQQAYFL